MIVLDSNHLRVLRTPGPASERLAARLIADGRQVATTVINVHEGINGWLEDINKANTAQAKVRPYNDLLALIEYYANFLVLPFDNAAAAQYDVLRRLPRMSTKGTMDLQIAAIAICHRALLLTADHDFEGIPILQVDDWLLDEPSDEPPYPQQE